MLRLLDWRRCLAQPKKHVARVAQAVVNVCEPNKPAALTLPHTLELVISANRTFFASRRHRTLGFHPSRRALPGVHDIARKRC